LPPNHRPALDAVTALRLHFGHHWRGASEAARYAAMRCLFFLLLVPAVSVAVLVGCTHEASTRKEQAQAFVDAFGFPPPDEVTEISYYSTGVWAPNFGGHLSLMRFSYVSNVVANIESKHALELTPTSFSSVEKAPSWWREPPPGGQIYRSSTNGIVRLMWIDKGRGYVFYQEFNVD